METKEVLSIIKTAQWDCDRITKSKLPIDIKLKALTRKYKTKFKIKDGTFYAIGRFFTEPMLNRFNYIDVESPKHKSQIDSFVSKLSTCDNCSRNCSKQKQERDEAISFLLEKYKNMAIKHVNPYKDLSHHDLEVLWQTVYFYMMHAIAYFDEKKNVKLSTSMYNWIYAAVVDYMNLLYSGKATNKKNKDKDGTILPGMQFHVIQESNLHEGFKIENELKSDDELHPSIFTSFHTKNKDLKLNDSEKKVINILYNPHFTLSETNGFDDSNITLLREKGEYTVLAKILNTSVVEVKRLESSALTKLKQHEIIYC